MTHDTQSISGILKISFLNLAESFLTKLPNPPDNYNLQYVTNYYSSFIITNDFRLNNTSEDKVLKIIYKTEISKASNNDRHSGRFFRDEAEVSSRPTSEICNLSICR